MSSKKGIESNGDSQNLIKLRTVDGGVYFLTSKRAVDYILQAEFLRFLIIVCLIYAMLHGNEDVPSISGWPFVAVWSFVFLVILFWLTIVGQVMLLLLKFKYIQQIWTPSVLFPLNLIIEFSVQGLMHWLVDQPFKPLGTTLADLTRDFAVLLLFDLLHGYYVVRQHPYAKRISSQDTMDTGGFSSQFVKNTDAPRFNISPLSDEFTLSTVRSSYEGDSLETSDAMGTVSLTPSTNGAKRGPIARIGAESFVLEDISIIRVEDHYLNITTRSGRSMPRAKLGAIEGLHNGDLGIQINRSVWVAFWAIKEVQPVKNGQLLLRLHDGDEELVAKPRVHAFRQALRKVTGNAV